MRQRSLHLTEAPISRNSIALSLSLLVGALIGVGQWFALTAIIGEGEQTDAFLAAYSLYLPLALLATSLRGALVPLFGPVEPETEFRATATPIASRAALFGTVLSALLLLSAPLTVDLVLGDLSSSARRTAVASLAVLAMVGVFQFRAAALSALLGASRRFQVSAGLYATSGVLGLACSAVFLAVIGPFGAALGLLVGSAGLAATHSLYGRSFALKLRARMRWVIEREQLKLSGSLASYASLGVAQQVNISIALAAVSGHVGAITVYTFAVYMMLVLLNVTSVSLAMVLLPDLVSDVARKSGDGTVQYALRVLPVTFAMVVPLLAAFLVGGRVILHTVLDPVLSERSTELLFDLGQVLCLFVIPSAFIQVGASIATALGRWRLTLSVSMVSIAVQVVIMGALGGGDPRKVAAAHAVTAGITALCLYGALFGAATPAVLARCTRAIAPAFLLGTIILGIRLPLGPEAELAPTLAALTVGMLLYVHVGRRLWADLDRVIRGLVHLRRRPALASARE